MGIDYSKIPTEDLQALKAQDYGKVSTLTLEYLKSGGETQMEPSPTPQPTNTDGGAAPTGAPDILGGAYRGAANLGRQAGDLISSGVKAIGNSEVARPAVQSLSDLINSIRNSDIGKMIINPQLETLANASEGVTTLKNRYPQSAEAIGQGMDIANLIPFFAAGKALSPAISALDELSTPAINKLAGAVGDKAKAFLKSNPNPEEALGQVLRSKAKTPESKALDMARGKKALSSIDITDIKTGPELNQRIADKIKDVAGQVDEVMARDQNSYTPEQLTKYTKVGSKVIVQNHVDDALNQLKELYAAINDPEKAARIEQLTEKLQVQGLSKKEINDLSREYGIGYHAFSTSTGEPLTGISKQSYENTRKGLKETARHGLSPEAAQLDDTLSSLLNTRRLTEQNIIAAQRLKDRIDPRKPLEKVSHGILKAIDFASNGLLRGVIGGLLPRGVGNKMLNALDWEEKLGRNLEIIDEGLVKMGEQPIMATPTVKTESYFGSKKKTSEEFY